LPEEDCLLYCQYLLAVKVTSSGAATEHSTGGIKRSTDDGQSASTSASDVPAAGHHKIARLGE